jgi:hypothetical protein
MAHVTDFIYHLDDFVVPGCPGLTITEGWLDITIERLDGDLDWHVTAVQLEKADKTVEFFYAGSFIFDAIVPHLYKNAKFSQSIMDEAHEII